MSSTNSAKAKKAVKPSVSDIDTALTPSILDLVKGRVKIGSTFPTERTNGLGLRRSVIPESCEPQSVKFFLDNESNLAFSAKAITLGITTDELLRHLVWSVIA